MREVTAYSAESEAIIEAAKLCISRKSCRGEDTCPHYDYDHGCEHRFGDIADIIVALAAMRRDEDV